MRWVTWWWSYSLLPTFFPLPKVKKNYSSSRKRRVGVTSNVSEAVGEKKKKFLERKKRNQFGMNLSLDNIASGNQFGLKVRRKVYVLPLLLLGIVSSDTLGTGLPIQHLTCDKKDKFNLQEIRKSCLCP